MNIRPLRQAAGLSQAAVAEKLNVAQQTVAKWESGTILPNAEKLPALADLLGCTIDALYGRGGDHENTD